LREGKATTTAVNLLNKNGDTGIIKRRIFSDATLGANLEAVEYGVKVSKIKNG
jgi:hypothetical protein